jgi:hypothetical protein
MTKAEKKRRKKLRNERDRERAKVYPYIPSYPGENRKESK